MEDDDWPIPEQSKSIESLFTLANTSYKTKNYDKALTWYGIILKRAEERSDKSADSKYAFIKSLYMISRCHMEKENYKEALDIADIVCDLVVCNCPEDIHFPEQLLIEINERLEDVVGAFILAIIFNHLHPSNQKCEKILSGVQAKIEESFTKSRSNIDRIFSVLTTKGKQFFKNKEYSTAVAFFEKIIEVFHFLPDDTLQGAYIWLTKCLLKIGDLDEAERNVVKVLSRFSSHTKARKLYQKIVDARKVKRQVQNASHPSTEIKEPLHQQEDSVQKSQGKEAKGTNRKERTISKTGAASVCYEKNSVGNDSTWEGLPSKQSQTPVNAINEQPQVINQLSNSSLKSLSRNRFSPLVVHEESAATCDVSSGSSLSNHDPKGESTNAEERVPQDTSQIEPSDKRPFQTVTKRNYHAKKDVVEEEAFRLPKGVEITCEHFRKEVFAHPQNSSKIPKVCQTCKAVKSCKYTYLRQDKNQWINVRNIPDNMRGSGKQIQNCTFFKQGKTHSDCTFAHGPELHMWDLQRKGVLPSPETYLSNLEMPQGNTVPNAPKAKTPTEKARKQSVEQTSGRATPSRQNLTCERPIHVNETPIQTSNCCLPPSVKIVCDHFIRERKYCQMRADKKTYVCKICGNKCRQGYQMAWYAFWSAGFREWRLIRPYPKELIRVAFRPCQDFTRNKPCVKRKCTFAHGPELSMWTMERKEILVPPWKAMFLNIVYTTDQVEHIPFVRQLPLGASKQDLRLCKSVESRIVCRFERSCPYPHSKTELDNWKKSYDAKIEESRLKTLQNSTSTTNSNKSIMHHDLKLTDSIQGVEISCHPEDPNVQLAEDCDNHTYTWEFCARFQATMRLPVVELQYHRQLFHFTKVCVLSFDNKTGQSVTLLSKELRETMISEQTVQLGCKKQTIEFRVTVRFQASVFGSFAQRILFNFGCQPFLKKDFNIDVGSKEALDRLTDKRQALNLEAHSWDDGNMMVIRCEPNPEKDKILSTYSLPKDTERIVSAQLVEGEMRKDSYKQTMHQLLFAEEVYMRELLLRLTPTNVKLQALNTKPSRFDGTEYAKPGHLFGSIDLQTQITLDDIAGRVCLRNVQSIWIRSRVNPKFIYELSSEIYGGKKIFVDLTPNVCKDLEINQNSIVDIDMRFNLNRHILCLMHKAVDSLGLTQARQLFPVEQSFTRKQIPIALEWILDSRLNDCQKQIIQEIAEVVPPSSPLVVFGPFGTGKTFTLNQATIYLMMEKTNRVLLCTHTNSAADIHVELLDEYLCREHENRKLNIQSAKPLRIYSPETEFKKTPRVSRKYALIKDDIFCIPTRKDILNHRVVITTLTTADLLTKLNVHHGFFTHILIDEAAQAWETEALIPIALAGPNTKIVFTGDHMQMSPEVYSEFATQWGLQKSLPERLFDHYRANDNKDQLLFLFENYRSTEEILKFSSENIYGGELVPMGNIPPHPLLPPLIFYSAKGKEEKQSDNSYLNSSEVYEVEKRVAELIEKWPACWGEKKLQDIAVVTPYKYQVDAIRDKLRRKRMSEVNVQTVHNVQGREYRALFISTVRTSWNSMDDSSSKSDTLSLEFLSDPKLLITAVTRAKSLVAVVGDPFALCTIGKCSSLWTDYIRRCNNLNGLFGTTWDSLTAEIEAHFQSSQLRLDPEAAPFVPKSQISDNDERQHTNAKITKGNEEKELKSSGNDTLNGGLPVEPEDGDDQTSSCSGDIQDDSEDEECYGVVEDNLDEAVLPTDIDRIIEELCKFIKIKQGKPALFDEEFPALTKDTSKAKETIKWPSKRSSKDVNVESLPSRDYRIVTRNGKTQIQLLNIYERPSERVQEIDRKNYKQQNLEPEVLVHLLQSDPSTYQCGQLRIANEKSRQAYLVIPDKEKPDVEVKGSVRHAFHQDTVVVEVLKSKQIVGVLNHIISPRERQYVCKVDPKNPSLMMPINRSVTCIVNLTDKSLEDIPIYKKPKTQDEKVSKGNRVRSVTTKQVMEKNLLFVVEFLQWRSDCTYPLGIAVRTIGTGESFERCKHIIFAECGIRKAFTKTTEKKIRQSFPTSTIPESEIKKREKIINAFTIDPPESKDLDDAVSVEKLRDGIFRVGVHIADVSFYVQSGSDLDREARMRGVSYYPNIEGEENITMLPTTLSENLLSLLPDQDRLTVSVFVTLDIEGKTLGQAKIERTVTRSCCRLSYSEAQGIIDEVDDQAKDIPNIVREGILQLHHLVVKRRYLRLEEVSLDHSNDKEDTDAHELIEELMILANHTVGNFLHRKKPDGVPFRTQRQPKVHRLNEWATNYGSYAKYSPALKLQLESEDITTEIKQRIHLDEREIELHEHVWNQINEAVESGDYRKMERLISDPMSSPQTAAATLHLRRIQTRSQYTCGGSYTKHHSLRLSNYVHFTSPIRRYIDIEVHRLLLTLISGNVSSEQHLLSGEDMATLCRRATYFKDNSGKFEKEMKRIYFASTMKKKIQNGKFFVDQVEKSFFTIHPVNPDQDHFLSKHKKIRFDDLSPYSKSDNVEGKPETTLTWRLRIYIGHSPGNDNSPPSHSLHMDANKIKKNLGSINNVRVQTLHGKTWVHIVEAIKERKLTRELLPLLEVRDIGKEESPIKSAGQFTSRDVYKHPNFGRKDDTTISKSDGHFHEIILNLKQFSIVDFQLFSSMHREMICPDVQLLRLSGICMCLEHRRYPRRCFAFDTKLCASKQKYESIDEYVRFWKPVLAIEASISAVNRNDGFILKSLRVEWSQEDDGEIEGEFTFTQSYCKSRQIQFHYGDLVCVKIPLQSEDSNLQCPVNSEAKATSGGAGLWIGHCIVMKNIEKNKRVTVTVRIHQMASEFPQQLLTQSQQECEMEFIYQPLPLRRMITALNIKLKNSSDLVQTVCLGETPSAEKFPIPTEDLSIKTSGFKPLNEYQDKAVRRALARPFSLIQGPPGTGKTVTGVHIAYWFAKQNRKLKSEVKKESDIPKCEKSKDKDKAPPQVLYCGPSNKSVDVITEYLLRIPEMKNKILRVHGTLIEESEYPIPNKIKCAKPYVSEDELRIPGQKVKEVSLHHFIRSSVSIYSEELKNMEKQFEEAKINKEKPNEEDVAKYCKTIERAQNWAFKEAGKEIILCTCSRAGSSTVTSGCDNIQQCIIDECGMCMEPEVLVPMTSSKAKQFVLIGDHKQLQPIVIDKRAKSLGLEMSMFERLSSEAMMLEIQYRMHPSICEFPSSRFYNGKLKTPDVVRFRKTADVKIWPALDRGVTMAFCHIEGVEESSVISTAESGVDSKYNKKEAEKAVQVAKYLVNNHVTEIQKKDVVILTPYRQQRKVIQDLLKGSYKDIHVTTVIKSQGSEWNYVILSLVRSLPEEELEPEPSSLWLDEHLGFITDDHQINVALTRAKHGLCIIGNKTLLSYDPTWSSLIKHCEENNCVVNGAWPWTNDEYQ